MATRRESLNVNRKKLSVVEPPPVSSLHKMRMRLTNARAQAALRVGQFKTRDEIAEGIDGNEVDKERQELLALSRFNRAGKL